MDMQREGRASISNSWTRRRSRSYNARLKSPISEWCAIKQLRAQAYLSMPPRLNRTMRRVAVNKRLENREGQIRGSKCRL